MRRYRITVDQGAIRRNDPNPIHVHDTATHERANGSDVSIDGRSRIRYVSHPEKDGARVFIETDTRPVILVS